MRITADELRFEARLQEYFDKAQAVWDALDAKSPPTQRELRNRELWVQAVEDLSWDEFWGVE